jgi:GTPase
MSNQMINQDRSLIISLIGRPNVGKSSLFNRLMNKQTKAITHDMPGVTRDRHYGITTIDQLSSADAQELIFVDTGGFYPEVIDESKEERKNSFFNIMREQAQTAIAESDLVLFMVDIREGLLPYDEDIYKYLRQSKKKFWLIINKYDSDKQEGEEYDFYRLPIDPQDMLIISAAHGTGILDLRERLQTFSYLAKIKGLEESKLQKGLAPKSEVVARLSLIGAPNAGKSTLLNTLLGEARALVSDIAGTTMDPIEGYFELPMGNRVARLDECRGKVRKNEDFVEQYELFRKNHPEFSQRLFESFENDMDLVQDLEEIETDFFSENGVVPASKERVEVPLEEQLRSIHIVDTAGIRRQSQIDDILESQSVYRSLRSISDSDLVLYLVDINKGITHHDKRLIDIAIEKGKSLVIVLNKLDMVKSELRTPAELKEHINKLRFDVPWLDYVDILPISAKHGEGIPKLLKMIARTIYIRNVFIPTSEVNKAFLELVNKHSVLIKGGRAKKFKVKYASQVKADPPTFLLFANRSQHIPENYTRYLQKGIREMFGMNNTPVHLVIRTSRDLAEAGNNRSKN